MCAGPVACPSPVRAVGRLECVTSSQPLEGGSNSAVFFGGWAPSLAVSLPTNEVRSGPKRSVKS